MLLITHIFGVTCLNTTPGSCVFVGQYCDIPTQKYPRTADDIDQLRLELSLDVNFTVNFTRHA